MIFSSRGAVPLLLEPSDWGTSTLESYILDKSPATDLSAYTQFSDLNALLVGKSHTNITLVGGVSIKENPDDVAEILTDKLKKKLTRTNAQHSSDLQSLASKDNPGFNISGLGDNKNLLK